MKSFYTAFKLCSLAACMLGIGCSDPGENLSSQDSIEPENYETSAPAAPPTKDKKATEVNDSAEQAVSEEEAAAISAKEAAEYAAKRKAQVAEIAQVRAGVVGKKFKSLTLSDRTFKGVTVSEINDFEIRLTHSGGIASIPWEQVDHKVKDLWGFDSEALEGTRRQQELAIAEREKFLNSPDQIKIQQEKERTLNSEKFEKREQEREAIAEQMRTLGAEIARGKTAIAKLKSSRTAMERGFKREDAEAKRIRNSRVDQLDSRETIGGISTSKADRNRPLELLKTQITAAENALKKLELEVQAQQKKLRAL